jgi:hypothetical protein
MINRSIARRLLLGAATGLALAVTGVSVPIVAGSLTPAMAQTSEDMTAALEAYGHWVRHASYGEVWVPDGVPPDWQPYEYGHWVFTDDWGWYWVSDENEDDWGWVVYHYGRWAFDRAIGWFWVPGDEWAPAWVDWRYGGDNVGWAPLPPDDLVDAYDEQPDYWVFVPLRYIGEPRLRSHFLPRDRRTFLLRETHIINRPVHVEGRRLWVNPGLAPGFIAGRTHVALHAYQVRPRVFGATTSVQGAVTVRQQDLRIKGAVRRAAPITVQRATTPIQAATTTAAPKPLGKGEHGQLGSHPPRAAQGGGAPQQQQQQGPAGVPPKTGTPVIQHPSPAPTVTPAAPPKPPERHDERRDVHPPAGAGGAPAGAGAPPPHPVGPAPQPQTIRPVSPPPPPPPPPPAVHAPPPPAAVHTPPPAVHAPPPPAAVHAPPPPKQVAPTKPGEKPSEVPK